ncbi:MAG TPA: Ig-like domain-containing protein [Prolixibacteraceae bacterium]|nr:Ig-like domain-containing protein [Prolixibacteraceae bacterium]
MILIFSLFMTGSEVFAEGVTIQVTDPAPVCFPATVDLTQPAITAGSTPGLIYTYYTDEALLTPIPDATKVGAGIYYIKGLRSSPYAFAATYIKVSVDPISVGGTIDAGQTICFGSSVADLILSGFTGNIEKWQKSDNVGFTSPIDIAVTSATLSSATIGILNSSTYFRAVVKSGGCSSANSTSVLITVTPQVGIPVVPTPSASTICQGSANTVYTTSASDAASYNWTVTGTGNSISGTGTTGTVTWAPGFSGITTVGVTVIGCNASTASSSTTVTVAPPVDTPVFTFGSTSTRCQGVGNISYSATAANTTGITYSLDAASVTGGNSIDPVTGTVTYTVGWIGTSIITASAAGCSGPKSALHTVTITSIVGTPVVPSPSATVICQGSPNTSYTSAATNATSYVWSVTGTGNTISGSGTTRTVTWASDFTGIAKVTVTANGCGGSLATASTTVSVNPSADIPVFAIGATSTRCQGAGTITYTATATNSTGLTYSLDAASLSGGNTIVAGTGAVTFVPGWSGTSTIVASAAGCNGPSTGTHIVTITPPVGSPVIPSPLGSTICQGSANTIYTTTAANATSYNWTVTGVGNSISGSGTTGTVTWDADFSGIATISVTANGCNGPSASASTNVTVTPAPFATLSYVAPLCSDDLTSHAVTLTGSIGGIFSASAGLTIDSSSGEIVPGTSTPDIYTVSYTIAPSAGCSTYSASTQVQIGSLPVLEDIVIKNVTCTGSNDGSLTAKASGIGSFTYEWTGPSSYSNSGASISALTPGVYTVKVTNAGGCSNTTSATVSESAIPLTVLVAGTNATKAGATDGTIDATISGGTIPYDFKWSGPASFTANTEDLTGLKFGSYSVSVTDKNGCLKIGTYVVQDPPVANDDTAVCIEDKSVTINVVANDVDADGTIAIATVDLDPLSAGLQTTYNLADKGIFSVSSEGVVIFTPVSHYLGLAVIQYVVSDNSGFLSNIANISVNVVLPNRPPVALDDNISIAEDTPANGNLLSNDSDPEGKTLTLESFTIGSVVYTPQSIATIDGVGTLLINMNGTYTFVPLENFNGIVPQVSYKVSDIEGLSASAFVNITVTPVNDPPVATSDSLDTKENNKLEANILINDFDIEGDDIILDVVPVQPTSHGELIISSNGDIAYQPVIDFIGSDTFTYQICDNGNPALCSIATVTIIVGKDANCDVFVPNVFTPNADGVHDYFKIRCLYNYENPVMQIFNRNGNLIFKKDHYGNLDYWGSEDQAFWNGRSANKLNLMNNELPVGTYYYILKLGDGKVLTGFIFLGK